MFDARQIANWFILHAAKDNRQLSIMQLLKLVYIAHGWHLEMRGTPLFRNKIEAWRHGPVMPDVYSEFRSQGVNVSKTSDNHSSDDLPQEYNLFLEQIYKIYGKMGAFRLSEITHEPGGPWDTAMKARGLFAPITNDMIRPHYEMKRKQLSNHAHG